MNQARGFTDALKRRFPASYVPFYRERGVTISGELAAAQHQAYGDALRAAGLRVHVLEGDEAFPDCVFLEDPAVVCPPGALLGRLAPHREGEQAPVRTALERRFRIHELPAGARLEGGDVLHAGDATYVGLSERTNQAGAAALAEFLRPAGRAVRPVPVRGYLHLKTAATWLGSGTLVAAADFDASAIQAERVIAADPREPGAANCLRLMDRLLVPAGHPRTEPRLRAFAGEHGVKLVVLDISEFEKADGSITCLSILW